MNRLWLSKSALALLAALSPFVLGADACSSSVTVHPRLGDVCGGLEAGACDVGLYCDFSADVTGTGAVGAGRCATVVDPTECTAVYDPVCGLDGRTYGNACLAAAGGMTVIASGECVPDVTGCIALYDPVCGSDGKTYGNACEAAAAGVPVVSTGECAGGACPDPAPLAPNTICPDGTIGGPVCTCDATGCHWELRSCPTLTVCGGFAGFACAPGEFCDYAVGDLCGAADQTGVCRSVPAFCTFEYAPVCGCDGNTYGNACMAAANGMSVSSIGACGGGGTTCDPASCGPAPASPFPVECVPDASGVCSWQATCFPPDCAAPPPNCHYEGYTTCTCGTLVCTDPTVKVCGGFGGAVCDLGEYCDYPISATCGATDQTGTCQPIPQACIDLYDPVCGCDGKTYSNACGAAANGISVASTGVCGSTGTVCDPKACGPAPLSPLPYECLPDANGTCTWQATCLPPPCAAPPPGCSYQGGTSCTCGTLVCNDCSLVDCLPPDPTCTTVPDGTCCGATVCP